MSKGQELFDIMKSFEQGDIDADMANGAIRAVLNNGTSASAVDTIVSSAEWISVEDRLPETEVECICSHDGRVFSSVYDPEHKKFYMPSVSSSRYKVGFYIKVSNWMPFPEPPNS
ncbi:DUF551 domain-containing protein [Gracilimonas sediminicola]|uniref:DUF551 domain-containing protein n=1 Tax=Gracilimonas sediminicola TaxID=2952158 RepID=A0A9X2L0H7_9BACT|nr:DUF551 domain-containing protein [Gracilimonas sediminicola]MCP9290013.1 DUF551 domain-containing protein [Gracilimonas sediminicola]